MKKSTQNTALISLIFIAIATRIIPHAPNFTAVGAVALFGGAMFKNNWKALVIPVLALFLSDLIINNVLYASFYHSFILLTPGFAFIYGGFLISVLIGRYMINGFKIANMAAAGVISTIAFYLVTNFGAWLANPIYTKDITGLMASYAAGIPFLGSQLAATFIYGAVLFGAAYYILRSSSKTVNA